jgi:hypothetical protein
MNIVNHAEMEGRKLPFNSPSSELSLPPVEVVSLFPEPDEEPSFGLDDERTSRDRLSLTLAPPSLLDFKVITQSVVGWLEDALATNIPSAEEPGVIAWERLSSI